MMYSEFVDRTKTEVTSYEYHFIEESYYDYDGNKDDFCKQWLKDVKAGRWAKELTLRERLEAAQENTKEWRSKAQKYAEQRDQVITDYQRASQKVREYEHRLERVKQVIGA